MVKMSGTGFVKLIMNFYFGLAKQPVAPGGTFISFMKHCTSDAYIVLIQIADKYASITATVFDFAQHLMNKSDYSL